MFCFKLKEANVVNLQLGNVGRNGMENNGKPQCNMTELLLACRGGGARRNSEIVLEMLCSERAKHENPEMARTDEGGQ